MASTPHNWPAMVSFLKNPIIGFHCLYSSQVRESCGPPPPPNIHRSSAQPKQLGRLVQLGVITRTDDVRHPLSSAMTAKGRFQDQLPSPISDTPWPFIELDDLYRPWVDGAPPKQLTRGRKNSDSMKRLAVDKGGDFAGWVSLRDPISRIIIYGTMEGIKISYSAKNRPDCCFGNTSSSVRGKTRFFYNSKAGSIVAIARYGPSQRSSTYTHEDDHLPLLKVGVGSQARRDQFVPWLIANTAPGPGSEGSLAWPYRGRVTISRRHRVQLYREPSGGLATSVRSGVPGGRRKSDPPPEVAAVETTGSCELSSRGRARSGPDRLPNGAGRLLRRQQLHDRCG